MFGLPVPGTRSETRQLFSWRSETSAQWNQSATMVTYDYASSLVVQCLGVRLRRKETRDEPRQGHCDNG